MGSSHLLQTLDGHVGTTNAVQFSHSAEMLLTAGDDHTVRVWSGRPSG